MTDVKFILKSRNEKTGPIPVTTSDKASCAPGCPLKGNGCYAEHGRVAMVWAKMFGAGDWQALNSSVSALPMGQLWRHNQAGDLPHSNAVIDAGALEQLTEANRGRMGFTYTHHDMTIGENREAIAHANANGFTVNLSGNSMAHADTLKALNIGPVVTVLPESVQGNQRLETPAGNRVVVCPATYRDDVTCASCKLCARADRDVIVGFPAHGAAKRKASAVAA